VDTWISAIDACEEIGGYLAEPQTDEQMKLLLGAATVEKELEGFSNWWIGLNEVGHNGVWIWQHSRQELMGEEFWDDGYPVTDTAEPQHCVHLSLLYLDHQYRLVWQNNKCEGIEQAIAPLCQCDNIWLEK